MTGLLAVAFATGMLAPVNPCGFALLPAYLAYQPVASGHHSGGPAARLFGGLRAGIAVTIGFAAVYTLAGLAVTFGLRALLGIAPWLGLAVGVLLAAAGFWLLTGRTLPTPRLPGLPNRSAAGNSGFGQLVLFGASYAIASLSCTLAILLAVIAQALASGSTLGLAGVFAAYTLGAATILLLVSVAAAMAGGALTSRMRRLLPAVPRISGAVLALAGLYLIAYWAPVAFTGQPAASPLNTAITAIAGPVSAWIAAHQLIIALATLALVAATVITAWTRRTRNIEDRPEPGDHRAASPAGAPDGKPPCC